MTGILWSITRGVVLGGATFALTGHAMLLAGGTVGRAWLPLCIAAGVAAAHGMRRGAEPAPENRAPVWLVLVTFAVVAATAIALAHGAMATSDRAWDGVVAWGLKSAALSAATTVEQPYFADAAVMHHSPDYPLLQPLCIASLAQWTDDATARLLFPAMYVLFIVVGGTAVAKRTGDRAAGVATSLALAMTPCFVNTNAGGADSGYAEMFLALAILAAAAALLTDDDRLLFAAAALLPLVKPEGTVFLACLAGSCFVMARREAWWAVLAGGALALSIWLPLQTKLGYRTPSPWLPVTVVSIAVVAAAIRWAADRAGLRRRGRSTIALGASIVAGIAIVGAKDWLSVQHSALLNHYLGGMTTLLDRLDELPAIAGGIVEQAIRPNRFGFALPAFVVAAWVAFRLPGAARPPLGAIMGWLCLGSAAIVMAFLLSPEPDLTHHLRSSAPRLLSHWVGVGWLVVGVVWSTAHRDWKARRSMPIVLAPEP